MFIHNNVKIYYYPKCNHIVILLLLKLFIESLKCKYCICIKIKLNVNK